MLKAQQIERKRYAATDSETEFDYSDATKVSKIYKRFSELKIIDFSDKVIIRSALMKRLQYNHLTMDILLFHGRSRAIEHHCVHQFYYSSEFINFDFNNIFTHF